MNHETELKVGTDMSTQDGRHFKKNPAVNVISKEEFEERISKVFHLLWKTLSKSFGPYGAPTLIYNYPYSHVTKDGYTIMKNLSMDASETLVDQAIADMAADICGRLNYTVGDGTTSAVIATNSIYNNYMKRADMLKLLHALPRDIINKFNDIKENVITRLQSRVRSIRSSNPDELYKNIYDVVYISSNGDKVITSYIAELYKELACPAISCELATDGVTKKDIINGYKYDLMLNDKLYINSDDNTMKLDEADIIILSTKVTKNVYEKVLKPLSFESKQRGRHLIVAAPFYDEVALTQVIRRDLTNEYSKNKDVNMVLCTYKAVSAHTRRLVEDFAVLCNTTVLDRPVMASLIEEIDNGLLINDVFNIDSRDEITGLRCAAYNTDNSAQQGLLFNNGIDQLPDNWKVHEPCGTSPIRLGYARGISIGLKTSIFADFFYDKDRYEACRKDAEMLLKEAEDKYKKLGTFNVEVSQAQQRYYSLNLKMGIIEVGADSELSQKLLKDAVDDAIKAAASAFSNGVVLGCNLDLISEFQKILDENIEKDENFSVTVDYILLKILYGGFYDVYKTVLINSDGDDKVIKDIEGFKSTYNSYCNNTKAFDELDSDSIEKILDMTLDDFSFYDIIIHYSICTHQVFDVSTKKFTNRVINSSQTDEEILKATIDLISLLITGNQMVVTQRHNF